jgi:hypothetical protein
MPRSSSSEREDTLFNNRNLRGGADGFENHTIMNGTEVQFFDDDFDNHTITNGTEDSHTIIGGEPVQFIQLKHLSTFYFRTQNNPILHL